MIVSLGMILKSYLCKCVLGMILKSHLCKCVSRCLKVSWVGKVVSSNLLRRVATARVGFKPGDNLAP